MAWIDITRNIYDSSNISGNFQHIVRDLFTLDGILYAIVQVQSRVPGTYTSQYKYEVYKHLGADPPVVDNIWQNTGNFFPMASIYQYKNAGTVSLNGYVYIGDSTTSQIYVNSTPNLINGQWRTINGPYGNGYSEVEAQLSTLSIYNNTLYAGHRGGVSKYNESARSWELAGEFTQGPGADGDARAFYVFQSELYVGVAYTDICIIYKWNSTVASPDQWIVVAELPPESTDITAISEYFNELIVIAKSPNKNIFLQRDIAKNFRGNLQFLQGDHLGGIPSSAIIYGRGNNALWVTCNDYEASITDDYTGDMNADGVINGLDLAIHYNYFQSADADTYPHNLDLLDVNGDGEATTNDVTLLAQYAENGQQWMIDNGYIPDVPHITNSRNLITTISENITDIEPTPILFVLDEFTSSGERTMHNIGNSIRFETEMGKEYINAEDAVSTVAFNQVPKDFKVLSNVLGYIDPTAMYTISCNISTTSYPFSSIIGGWNDSISIHNNTDYVAKVALQMGLVNPNDNSPIFLGDGTVIGLPISSELTEGSLPYWSDGPSRNLRGGYHWDSILSYTFLGAAALAKVDGKDIQLCITGIDSPGGFITKEVKETGNIGGKPGKIHVSNRYIPYVTDIIFSDFQITYGEGVVLGAEYISKYLDDVPSDNDKSHHTIVSPSGPDQWFIKAPGIYDGNAPTLRKPKRLLPFSAGIECPFTSNDISFLPGNTYTFSFVGHVPPIAAGTPIEVDTTRPSYLYAKMFDNDGNLVFNMTRYVEWSSQYFTFSTEFTIPEDGTSSTYINLNAQFGAFRFAQDQSFYDSNIVSSPDVYFSDINITQRHVGSSGNFIYKYEGSSWDNINVSTVSPSTYTGIPYKSLVSNYDNRSEADQLYAVGGGKVWVWDYVGGLYAGNDTGIQFDTRPQIINIL